MKTATLNRIDCPAEYDKLTLKQQLLLQDWIAQRVDPYRQKSFSGPSSYWLKHHFETWLHGFYITNGAMKGAMAAAGYEPENPLHKNWTYQLSNKMMRLEWKGVR